MRSYDVAIVGAGPAGAAAAAALAPQHRVVMIDRLPSRRWRIGESLPGAVRQPLLDIGCWERFAAAGHLAAPLRMSRWGSAAPTLVDAIANPDGAGWQIDRRRFEADLQRDAVARGAELRVGQSVQQVTRQAGGWRLRLDDDSLEARVLVDASGRRSRLMRPYGQRRRTFDHLVALYQHVRPLEPTLPLVYVEAAEGGWWHTAPLPDGDRIVAFYGDADLPDIRTLRRDGLLKSAQCRPDLAEVIGPIAPDITTRPGLSVASPQAQSAAGDGWFAVGDSTLCFDPLSSQGLFHAVVSGIDVGSAAQRLLAGGQDAVTDYADRAAQVWAAYWRHHSAFYALETRWPEQPFWRRRLEAFRATG